MIATLQAQLHFVRAVQAVDVEGIEPLRAIRDETDEGRAEATIGIDCLRAELDAEVRFGRWRRPKRVRDYKLADPTPGVEDWDVLDTAQRTAGRYFVVKTGKGKEGT